MATVYMTFDIPEEFDPGEALLIGADAMEEHGFNFFSDEMRRTGELLSNEPPCIEGMFWRPTTIFNSQGREKPGKTHLFGIRPANWESRHLGFMTLPSEYQRRNSICGHNHLGEKELNLAQKDGWKSDLSNRLKHPLCRACLKAINKHLAKKET